MQDLILPSQYIRQISGQLAAMDVDVSAWLERSQLSDGQLSEADLKVDASTFGHLLEDALVSVNGRAEIQGFHPGGSGGQQAVDLAHVVNLPVNR